MDDGERRFQLMRGIERELPRLGEGKSETLLHAVEDSGHAIQFIAIAAARHGVGEIGNVCLFQRFGEFLNGSQGAAHEQSAAEDSEQDGWQAAIKNDLKRLLQRVMLQSRLRPPCNASSRCSLVSKLKPAPEAHDHQRKAERDGVIQKDASAQSHDGSRSA
jgi:hypothetical protein